jgi:hypothetical protein
MQLMLQATVCDCLALDHFAFEEDGLSAPEVDVSWGKIVEALVIAGMVVMRHEGRDLAFEVAGALSHPARRGSLAAPCRLAKPLNLLNPSLTVRQVVSSKNG